MSSTTLTLIRHDTPGLLQFHPSRPVKVPVAPAPVHPWCATRILAKKPNFFAFWIIYDKCYIGFLFAEGMSFTVILVVLSSLVGTARAHIKELYVPVSSRLDWLSLHCSVCGGMQVPLFCTSTHCAFIWVGLLPWNSLPVHLSSITLHSVQQTC